MAVRLMLRPREGPISGRGPSTRSGVASGSELPQSPDGSICERDSTDERLSPSAADWLRQASGARLCGRFSLRHIAATPGAQPIAPPFLWDAGDAARGLGVHAWVITPSHPGGALRKPRGEGFGQCVHARTDDVTYSARNARLGSARAPRKAGMALANAATTRSTPTTVPNTTGSRGD